MVFFCTSLFSQSIQLKRINNYDVFEGDSIAFLYNATSTSDFILQYSCDSPSSWINYNHQVYTKLVDTIRIISPNIYCNYFRVRAIDFKSNTVSNEVEIKLNADTLSATYYKWVKISNSLPFSNRDGAGLLNFNNKLYLLGGWHNDSVPRTNNEVWSSDDAVNWTFIKKAPWEQRHTFGCLIFNNKIWILGGDVNSNHYQPDVWNSSNGIDWNLIQDTTTWGFRVLFNYHLMNNKMWVYGGQKIFNNNLDTSYNDIYSSQDGVNWFKEVNTSSWSPRGMMIGNVNHLGKIWMLGGGTYTGDLTLRMYSNEVWNTKNSIQWNFVSNAPWVGRQYHNVISFDNKVWVTCGYNYFQNGNLNDTWYSKDGMNWVKVDSASIIPRHAASLVEFKGSLILLGGPLYNDDIWSLSKGAKSFQLNAKNILNVWSDENVQIRTSQIIGAKYNWFINQNPLKNSGNSIIPKADGIYELELKTKLNDTLPRRSVIVNVLNAPGKVNSNKQFNYQFGTEIKSKLYCINDSDLTYQWYHNNDSLNEHKSEIIANKLGDYFLRASFNQAYKYSDTISIKYNAPKLFINYGSNGKVNSINTHRIIGAKYSWYRNDVLLASEIDSAIKINSPGYYQVKITTKDSIVGLSEKYNVISTDIESERNNLNVISLINSSTLYIKLSNTNVGENFTIKIYNSIGALIHEESLVYNMKGLYYSIESIPFEKGMYIVFVSSTNNKYYKKIVM